MSVPTIYFPDIPYRLFRHGRQHATEVSPGAGGRRQARIVWSRPKRRMTATLLGIGGSQFTVSSTTFKTLRKFLTLLHGQYRNFYIFDPHVADYDQEEPESFVGLFVSWPMVTPFKGGTITAVYDDGVIMGGAITQDSAGTGGEKRIVTVGGGAPGAGSLISVEITGAQQRIPAVMVGDYDDFAYDFSAADPPVEYSLDLEEDFG